MTEQTSFLYKRGNRILLAAGLTALTFLLAALLCKVTFLNNDDVSIQRALAGWQTGEPYPAHPFLNILLSAPVSLLYRLLPAVAWWGRLQQAAMFFGLTIIGCCVFLAFDRARIPAWAAAGTFFLLLLGVFSYALVQITFTLTASILGTAAVALTLTEDPARPNALSRRIAAPCLLFLCFLFRNSSGISLVPFFLLAACYRFLRPLAAPDAARAARIRHIVSLLLGVLLSAIAICTNAYGRIAFNDPGYEEFDAARSAFADYPHVSYEADPALYESVGWDETLCDLAASWCFFDERIDAESLNTIAGASKSTRTVMQKLKDAADAGIALGRGNGQMQWMLAFPVGLFLLAALLLFFRKDTLLPALCTFCFACGAFLLCGYLCYTGRFLLRTFMLIAFPATVGLLLMLMEIAACPARRLPKKRLIALIAAAALIPALLGTGATLRTLYLYSPEASLTRAGEAYAYALSHPERIFIRDSYSINDVDAFRVFPDQKPTNVIDWGGNGMLTGALSAQLRKNGLSSFGRDTLLLENVCVITTAGSAQETFLLRYASDTLHADRIEKIEEFGDRLVVYRFGKDA